MTPAPPFSVSLAIAFLSALAALYGIHRRRCAE